jgi:hypothetical protein
VSLLRNITSGLRSLFQKEQVDRELDEELNGFLEMADDEKMQQGMSRKGALGAGGSRSYEGIGPLCRLGILC